MIGTPAPPRSIDTRTGMLAFHEVGEGPPVLLVHGFPASSWQWRELIPLLAARFRVIVPDMPGSGASVPGDDAVLDLAAQAGALVELLDELRVEGCAIVAHGEGAAVAQAVALDRPGIDALVLLDAATLDAWPSRQLLDARGRLEAEGTSADVVRSIVREHYEHGALLRDRLPLEVVDAYAAPWLDGDGPPRFARVVAGLAGRGLAGREQELGAIDVPVLLLWGEDDPMYPASVGERLNDAMPSSTLGLLPGCGHFLLDEAIETIGPMIAEYLRARYARAPHGHGDPHAGVVMLQLERRPPWVDLAADEHDPWFDVDEPAEAANDAASDAASDTEGEETDR